MLEWGIRRPSAFRKSRNRSSSRTMKAVTRNEAETHQLVNPNKPPKLYKFADAV